MTLCHAWRHIKLGLALALACSFGCAGPSRQKPPFVAKHPTSQEKTHKLELAPWVVTPTSAATVDEICDRGMRHFAVGEFEAADQDLGLCVRVAPSSPNTSVAMYYHAIALDQLGRLEAALEQFNTVADGPGDHAMRQAASLRAVRLACHLERWDIARKRAELLLQGSRRLSPLDTVLVRGALALDAVFHGDDTRAELHVGHARTLIEEHHLDAPGKIARDVAAVYFALGEIRRIRGERITLVPSPRFAEVLERRCELILAAQSAYSDAMRALDAHWSMMSGFRIGELYGKLHQELMQIPLPQNAKTPAQRQLFEGAMRLRYSVLVQKALRMIEQTLAMAERTGETSPWVDRARAAARDLQQRLQDEQTAIERLPYSREALESALHELVERSH